MLFVSGYILTYCNPCMNVILWLPKVESNPSTTPFLFQESCIHTMHTHLVETLNWIHLEDNYSILNYKYEEKKIPKIKITNFLHDSGTKIIGY